MILSAGPRKLLLTVHVTSSVGLLGAVACFLLLAVVGLLGETQQTAQVTYPAMDLVARLVIVPLALTALLLGTVQSLCTAWGLFRHWWVVIKLLLTLFVTVVLLIQMPIIASLAEAAQRSGYGAADTLPARLSLVVHAGAGLALLLVPMVLSIYKPRGLTRYGQR